MTAMPERRVKDVPSEHPVQVAADAGWSVTPGRLRGAAGGSWAQNRSLRRPAAQASIAEPTAAPARGPDGARGALPPDPGPTPHTPAPQGLALTTGLPLPPLLLPYDSAHVALLLANLCDPPMWSRSNHDYRGLPPARGKLSPRDPVQGFSLTLWKDADV